MFDHHIVGYNVALLSVLFGLYFRNIITVALGFRNCLIYLAIESIFTVPIGVSR